MEPLVSGSDDAVGVSGPSEWLRLGRVVLRNEAVDGGLEIDEGMKHPALQATPGQLGEEALDGVQPGAAGGHEVEGPARMPLEPGKDLGVLVGRVVVEDHVDFLAGRDAALDLVEEADELLMAVALHVPADHGPVEHVQRREQRGRPIPLVVVRHAAGPALLHWQAWLGAVQRLDLGLFIHRQDHGMRGRIDIEAHHVGQLVHELRVVRELERAPAMRAQPVCFPDPPHRRGRDAHALRHRPQRPVRCLVRRRLLGQPHDLGHLVGRRRRNAGRPGLVTQKAIDAFLHEPLLPAPDTGLRLARRRHDRGGAEPGVAQENDPGPPDMLLGAVAIRDDRFQSLTVAGRDAETDTGAHLQRLAHKPGPGNPETDSSVSFRPLAYRTRKTTLTFRLDCVSALRQPHFTKV